MLGICILFFNSKLPWTLWFMKDNGMIPLMQWCFYIFIWQDCKPSSSMFSFNSNSHYKINDWNYYNYPGKQFWNLCFAEKGIKGTWCSIILSSFQCSIKYSYSDTWKASQLQKHMSTARMFQLLSQQSLMAVLPRLDYACWTTTSIRPRSANGYMQLSRWPWPFLTLIFFSVTVRFEAFRGPIPDPASEDKYLILFSRHVGLLIEREGTVTCSEGTVGGGGLCFGIVLIYNHWATLEQHTLC